MADGGGGLFEILEDFADLDVEQDWLGKLSQNFGIPVSFAFAAGSKARQMQFNDFLDRVNAGGESAGGGESDRPSFHRLPHQIPHVCQIFACRRLVAAVAHRVHAKRDVRKQHSKIAGRGGRSEGRKILGESLPRPLDTLVKG
eukprot:COSAG05_NODE_5097_length_1264_cov_1.104721_2_plen_143_part_01